MYVFLFVILDDEFIRLSLLRLINKVLQTYVLLRQFSHLLRLTAGAVTVGNMYRPLHTVTVQLTSFIDYFTDRLSLLNVRETTVVYGDFHINLLSINSNEHYNAFKTYKTIR